MFALCDIFLKMKVKKAKESKLRCGLVGEKLPYEKAKKEGKRNRSINEEALGIRH